MILDRIKELGFQFSTKSGVTISFSDILIATNRKEKILEGEEYTDLLKEKFQLGLVTDDERYRLSNHK
jgi:DNA-directed RNA polymerase subunit beta'